MLEIQPEIAWTHVRDRLVAWARGLSLHFFSGLSRFLQSGGLLNFLHWLDENFLATWAGLATLTIFSAIVGAVKSMHVNGVSTRPPALPLAILDGRLENQVPPSLEASLTAAAPLSEALLSNSDISSSSYVKVNQGGSSSPASWSSISSKDSVELVSRTQVDGCLILISNGTEAL